MNNISYFFCAMIFYSCTLFSEASENKIIAEWKLNEGKGTSINDHSGNGYNGIYRGQWAEGSWGKAIYLNGDYITFSKKNTFDLSNKDFSISFWALPRKLEFNKKQKTLRMLNAIGPNCLLVVDLEGGGKVQLEMGMKNDKGQWKWCNVTSKEALKINAWSNIVISFNRQKKMIKIYVNAQKTAEALVPVWTQKSFSNYKFTIGSSWHGFYGLLSDMKIFNYVINKKDVIKSFAAAAPTKKEARFIGLNNPACIPQKRDDWSKGLNKIFCKRAAKGNIDLLFIGDSITHLWFKDRRWANGQKTWDKYYKSLQADNFGIAGDRTEHLLWRITEGKELENISPKVIVLLIGTNNLHRPRKADTPEQIAEGIGLIISTIREKLPKTKILLLAVFPRLHMRNRVKAVNSLIKPFADYKNVFYLDLGKKFLKPDGTIDKLIIRDGVHLSSKGYEIWAKTMNPYLFDLIKNNNKIDWNKE